MTEPESEWVAELRSTVRPGLELPNLLPGFRVGMESGLLWYLESLRPPSTPYHDGPWHGSSGYLLVD